MPFFAPSDPDSSNFFYAAREVEELKPHRERNASNVTLATLAIQISRLRSFVSLPAKRENRGEKFPSRARSPFVKIRL